MEIEEHNCRRCHKPASKNEDGWAGKMGLCAECLIRASASETLKRLKPINDPLITEALKDL